MMVAVAAIPFLGHRWLIGTYRAVRTDYPTDFRRRFEGARLDGGRTPFASHLGMDAFALTPMLIAAGSLKTGRGGVGATAG